MEDQEFQTLRKELFARLWSEVAPMADEIEETESIPRDRLFPILADLKVFAMLIPEQHGGLGLSIAQYLPVIAEFAKIHGGIRALVHVHNSMCHAYAELGSEQQAQAVLPSAARGESSVAFALTEPEHGTGADLGTTAVRDGDHYVLNGRKWLITNSDFASHFIVFARTGTGRAAISALSVERGLPGFTIKALPETMGCKGGQHGQLTFEDVRVPVSDLLGEEGQGLAGMERSLEISRVLVAGSSLGTAEYALQLSLQHARERVTFGKPIAERQAVQRYLAEMAQDVYALRLMLDDVADKYDRGQPIPLEASLVKLFGLEAVGRVTDRALLVHGGIGYTRARSIERLYRDARLNWLEEGTPTIQHMVAARQLVDGNWWAEA